MAAPLLPGGGPAMAALREGVIEPVDLATLLAIAQSFEFVSGGRCWASWEDLQLLTGLSEAQVRESADRLLAAQLVACNRDRDFVRWWYWRLHPQLFTDCRTTRQADARRWAEWREALASGCRPDDRVSGTRPRFLRQKAREREQLEAAAAGAAEPAAEPVAVAEGAQVLTAALAPAGAAAAARGRRRPAGNRRPAGGGEPQSPPAQARVQPAAVLPPVGRVQPAARVVNLRPSPEHRAADLAWRAEAEQRRRQRQQQQAAAS